MMPLLMLLIMILWLAGVSPAVATTWYISTTGSDSTGNGTSGNPWQTFNKCTTFASVVSGDTCMAKAGTYTTASSSEIALANKAGIIYQSETALGAKLDGQSNATFTAFTLTASNVQIIGFEMYGFGSAAVNDSAGNLNNILVKGNVMHDIGRRCYLSSQGQVGIYLGTGTTNATIERNIFYTIGRYLTGESGCTQTFPRNDHAIYIGNSNGLTIRRNIFYNIKSGFAIQLYPNAQTNVTIRHNVFANQTAASRGSIVLRGTITTLDIANNIFHNNDVCPLNVQTGSVTFSGATVRNNLITNNLSGLWSDASTCVSAPSGVTATNNTLNTSAQFTDATNHDYTLTSGSPKIDGGIDVGLAFNGSAPDIGAFETFVFSACSIANGTPGVINATFTNNVNPPLLPLSGVTTFTARKAGVADTVTGVTRAGDNQLDIAVQNNYANGNAADISWASGNLTDSALIGGTLNQPYVETLTNRSCTNNVGGSPSYLFIQAAYEWHGLRGTEAAPVMLRTTAGATENLDIQTFPGGKARLRIAVTCTTADCPPEGFYPYFSRNGGAYTLTPDTFGADNFQFCGTNADPDIPANFTPTTDQLSATGTLASPVGGQIVRTSNAVPTVDLDDSPATKAELEYCFATDTDTAADTTFDIQLRRQDGTSTNMQFDVTPRITVRTASGGMGF